MKRFITIIFIVGLYSFSLTQQVNAIFCSNCSTIMQQIPQYATEAITTAKDTITAYSTSYLQLKASVFDPLGNAMIAVSLLNQQNKTLNLVTGALGGNSLLKSDPQKWINDQGLNVVQISLSDLNNSKGVFSNSLFGNVVSTFKAQNTPLQTKIDQASQSSIPSIVQNNLCSDEQLTAIAKGDVENSDGTYDPAALTARKQEIYNSLCTGDPTTNPQLAQKLQQVNNQRPDIGGWNSWLATINGDNGYTKSATLANDVAQKAEEAKTAATNDLNRGNGLASPRVCNQTVQQAPNGDQLLNISDALCRSYSLTNSAGGVNSAFQDALNSGVDRLKTSFGADILSTLSGLLSARNTINLLGNAFNSVSGGGSNSGSNNVSNSSSTTVLAQDLSGNSDAKNSLISPMMTRLNAYLSSLDQLAQADSDLSGQITIAENNLSSMKSCYQNLIDNNNYTASDPQIAPALSYYQSQMIYISGLQASVSQDSSEIGTARDYVSQIETVIQNSNSSQEINDAYSTFQEKISNGTFPSDTAYSQRQGDFIQLQGYNQTSLIEGGQLYTYNQQCSALGGRVGTQ